MTECNLATVSENQRINIKNFCEDRKSEMEMVANYAMTQAAIKESVGEPSHYDAGKVDLEYINNVLKERKKYGVFVASISILDKDFRVVASSESYEAGHTQLCMSCVCILCACYIYCADIYYKECISTNRTDNECV